MQTYDYEKKVDNSQLLKMYAEKLVEAAKEDKNENEEEE